MTKKTSEALQGAAKNPKLESAEDKRARILKEKELAKAAAILMRSKEKECLKLDKLATLMGDVLKQSHSAFHATILEHVSLVHGIREKIMAAQTSSDLAQVLLVH